MDQVKHSGGEFIIETFNIGHPAFVVRVVEVINCAVQAATFNDPFIHGITVNILLKRVLYYDERIDLIFSHVNQATGKLDLPDHNFVFTENFSRLVADVRRRTGKREPSSK